MGLGGQHKFEIKNEEPGDAQKRVRKQKEAWVLFILLCKIVKMFALI